MKTIKPCRSVLVFDLDDTLYAEFDYKVSGIKSVVRRIADLYPQYGVSELETLLDFKKQDWLDTLCRHCGLNEAEQQSLLWHYRLHTPDIAPYLAAANFAALTKDFAATALISDGRSITQRLKLSALGLSDCFDDILISEAYGSQKPDGLRFQTIQNKYAGKDYRFIYIGDNIKKDFITPKRMGWLTIGLEPRSDNIHIHNPRDFDSEYHPEIWLKSLSRLSDLITN